ncbi:MAG: sialidase family protein [Phycisphaerae bacterium]
MKLGAVHVLLVFVTSMLCPALVLAQRHDALPAVRSPVDPAGAPAVHREVPKDPWMPRPMIPPERAVVHTDPWTRGPYQSIQVNIDEFGGNIVGDAGNEPSIAIDPTDSNNIVIGWRQFDNVESDFRQADFAYSHDGGQTWSFPGVLEPGVFSSDPVLDADADGNFYYYSLQPYRGPDAWQWFGTMSVAPHGRIDVVWNDTRNTGEANRSELFYAFSTDGGLTWFEAGPVSPVFDSHIGWPNQNKLGDYYDMISDEAGASVAYAATFNGEQDVYFLRVGDCNRNGIHDAIDVDEGMGEDCDGDVDLMDFASFQSAFGRTYP